MKEILSQFSKSKKFWAMIAGLAFLCIATPLGMDNQTIVIGEGLIASYMVSQGIADNGKL
jgi:hypothetical protein